MQPKQLLFIGGGALSLSALAALSTVPRSCHLEVLPDYEMGVMYRAVLRPSTNCPLTTVLRVRKSSTISLRHKGAPYQPIYPLTGAWSVDKTGHNVPSGSLWTLYDWKWQWYTPQGHWEDAEVINRVQNAP